jgi:hypothetical protein
MNASDELLTAMGRYNGELKRAGVLVDLAGLLPSAEGRRVKFSRGSRAVVNGPFDESKKLTAAVQQLSMSPSGAVAGGMPGRSRALSGRPAGLPADGRGPRS